MAVDDRNELLLKSIRSALLHLEKKELERGSAADDETLLMCGHYISAITARIGDFEALAEVCVNE